MLKLQQLKYTSNASLRTVYMYGPKVKLVCRIKWAKDMIKLLDRKKNLINALNSLSA